LLNLQSDSEENLSPLVVVQIPGGQGSSEVPVTGPTRILRKDAQLGSLKTGDADEAAFVAPAGPVLPEASIHSVSPSLFLINDCDWLGDLAAESD